MHGPSLLPITLQRPPIFFSPAGLGIVCTKVQCCNSQLIVSATNILIKQLDFKGRNAAYLRENLEHLAVRSPTRLRPTTVHH